MRVFTNKTETIKFTFPPSWNAESISGLTLTVSDYNGNELEAASAAAIYTATTLDSAASQFDTSITLDSGAGNLFVGDFIQLSGVGGTESHVVKGYDDTNKIATLETSISRDFEDGASVFGLTASINVDMSNTTIYTGGLDLVLKWIPTGTGDVVVEAARIYKTDQSDIEGFEERFRYLFRRVWEALKDPEDRFDVFYNRANGDLRRQLLGNGLDIGVVVDHSALEPCLMLLIAIQWALVGEQSDDSPSLKDELNAWRSALDAEFNILKSNPIWVDDDMDLVEDDGEVSSHNHFFRKVWS